MDSRPRPERTRLDYSDAGPGDATEPGGKLLRSNQQSRVSCFARSADFKLGQQVAAESPAIACSSHQISMVAAAITTPVTNAAKHENSRRSFSTPVMAASPMRASHVGVSSPEGSSALLYRGGNVTSRTASYAEQICREERLSPIRTPDERAGSGLHQHSWRGPDRGLVGRSNRHGPKK